MRFGRIILAGLAPLVGLSALAAGLAGFPHLHISAKSAQQAASTDPMPRLLQVIIPLMISAVGSATASPSSHDAAHAVLTLGALWLLASVFAMNLLERLHPRAFLRC